MKLLTESRQRVAQHRFPCQHAGREERMTADGPSRRMLGAAALGSGLPILGWMASQWGKDDAPAPPVVSQPAEQGERNGSLYQFLEDDGFHLPENE